MNYTTRNIFIFLITVQCGGILFSADELNVDNEYPFRDFGYDELDYYVAEHHQSDGFFLHGEKIFHGRTAIMAHTSLAAKLLSDGTEAEVGDDGYLNRVTIRGEHWSRYRIILDDETILREDHNRAYLLKMLMRVLDDGLANRKKKLRQYWRVVKRKKK